jgi:tetratricopeptide (TPR) repeat protein
VSEDISGNMRGWDYDPSAVNARWIKGHDGKLKIQLRLDLGLFQMETQGRPDGTRPHGQSAVLDYYRAREKEAGLRGEKLTLDAEACAELQQEAMQYYYRYLSYYALRHFEGVVADTEHNLAIVDFVSSHTRDEDAAWQFLQFYPYIRMMNARARAERAMAVRQFEEAIRALQTALDDIQSFWEDYGDGEAIGDSQEVEMLNDLMRQVKRQKPKSREDRLREDLAHAIAAEDYEKAASLRDEINQLPAAPPSARRGAPRGR